jgi:hypothetical protein
MARTKRAIAPAARRRMVGEATAGIVGAALGFLADSRSRFARRPCSNSANSPCVW